MSATRLLLQSRLNRRAHLCRHVEYLKPIGKLATTTDEYGRVTAYDYDLRGNLIRTVYPDGTETRTAYDADNRPVWTTDRYASTSTYNPATGSETWDNTATALATETIYDSAGRAVRTLRFQNVLIAIVADTTAGAPSGTMMAVAPTVSAGQQISVASTAYNGAGQVASQADAGGLTTSTSYYPNGQVQSVTQSPSTGSGQANPPTTDTYSTPGVGNPNYSTVTDPLGNATTTQVDALGRTIKVTNPDGHFSQTLYSVNGAPVTGQSTGLQSITGYQKTEIDPMGNVTDSFYDAAGRLTDVYQPRVLDALPTSPTYNQMIRPHWQYVYDSNGNLWKTIDPKGNRTLVTFDPLGNELTRTQPDGTSRSGKQYNGLGQVILSTDADGNVAAYSYYPGSDQKRAGLLQSVAYTLSGASQPSQVVNYDYDSLGRKKTVIDSLNGTTSYAYDPITGQVASVASPQGMINYVYDPATGRETEVWTGTVQSVAANDTRYGYDVYGHLGSVTIVRQNNGVPPAPIHQLPALDARGNVVSTTLPTTDYSYNADGQITSEIQPNGTETDYTYTDTPALHQRTVANETSATGAILSKYVYTLDADGRKAMDVEQRAASNGSFVYATFSWGYDSLSRLTSEAYTGTTTAADNYSDVYTYDLGNNRDLKTHTTGSSSTTEAIEYSYNSDNQLTQTADSLHGTSNFTYDPNGSQKTAGTSTFIYDARNRLTSATVNGVTTIYAYNDDGDRISKTVSGAPTYYLVDTSNPSGYSQVAQESATLNGAPTSSFVSGPTGVFAQNVGGVGSYLMPDGHGSTRLLTSNSGDYAWGHRERELVCVRRWESGQSARSERTRVRIARCRRDRPRGPSSNRR